MSALTNLSEIVAVSSLFVSIRFSSSYLWFPFYLFLPEAMASVAPECIILVAGCYLNNL